ncbi:uncharacterized protein LOC131293982 [Anopheles ziemanni]|uniref:uncharacterized protein LOC131264735 n=1 Tax=Anopheles coustani TaxID=139045 RepID=UPI0026594AA7|nr:uncharacterized protein LOC131264735 [Anopheles coustani]XP_058178015.1 uncharacterized protein LOC131293982 [Anopheles ziemanni]
MARFLLLIVAISCGLSVTVDSAPISGAKDSPIEGYAFMAIVALYSQIAGNGVIVSTRWVLTAASTFHEGPDTEYCAVIGGSTLRTGTYYRTLRIYRHPEFDGSLYNVGLLHLAKELVLGPTINIVHTPRSSPPDMRPVILSFGKNSEGTTHLQSFKFKLTSDSRCVERLSDVHDKQVILSGQGYCIDELLQGNRIFEYNDVGAPAITEWQQI